MQKVRLQNLRDFTVQICRPSDDAIVGTGIVVSMDGKVVTCAHVVQIAIGVHPRDADDAEVGVYFPQVRDNEKKAHRAVVVGCFAQHDDDVVLLQLLDGPSPLAPEQIAVLGMADDSCYHPFRSYGYRRLDKFSAGHAHGTILGCVEAPDNQKIHCEPVQLESQHINAGMSGSAVLDVECNLVVGVISDTWFSGGSFKDRDTGWAVNARVLSLEPLGLPMQDAPLPKREAPQPKTDIQAARNAVAPQLGIAWNNAPPPLKEWVGREELLKSLHTDWQSPGCRVTGLIGFGGEGKSSLARKWVEELSECESSALATKAEPSYSVQPPDGVFWWGFYTRPNVEEFFEVALKYLGGGRIDPRALPSTNIKAQVLGAMLGAGRYLFVLDGLEILQHQEGDQYGLLQSNELQEFLSFFADPQQQSFCLITSRAPVLDLMDYTTYSHRDITRLSAADGRALLRKVDVQGDDETLAKIVADWDGHALTLSLLGAYLVDQHDGDATKISIIPPPNVDELRYERVHRVLRRYDEYLTDAERAFLLLFSAFRTPVAESALHKVCRAKVEKKPGFWGRLIGQKSQFISSPTNAMNAPIAALDDAAFAALLQRLLAYRILHHDPHANHYTTHPLIRNHYFVQLTQGDSAQQTHEAIKDYYLELAGDMPTNPTLDDLMPLIEVVHHACRAGAYDEAHGIRRDRIYQGNRKVLISQLGAWETDLALMQEFFSDGDTSQEPQVSKASDKSWILNEVGVCLMSLGRLNEAVPFYERSNAMDADMEDWHNANVGYVNLAWLHAYVGALSQSAAAAREALQLARRAENKRDKRYSLAEQAWAAHLLGDLKSAADAFRQAEVLEQEIDPNTRYLYGVPGIRYADHLQHTGDADYAWRVTEANLEICERNRWPSMITKCHRVLGDLDADAGHYDSARRHYDEALKIARNISDRAVLIEALLARGRFFARCLQDALTAFSDLRDALAYALNSGYRIYEVDIRIALAWAHALTPSPSPKGRGEKEAARAEAQRALQMSREMDYYWGQKDAEEVLGSLGINTLQGC